MNIVSGVCAVAFGVAAGVWFLRIKKKRADEPPPESIVVLLKQPETIDATRLADIFSRVTGRTISASASAASAKGTGDSKPANDLVAGASPHFIAVVGGTWYAIHNFPIPYAGDPVEASESVREQRLSKVLRDHRAWLSIDILRSKAATPEAYRLAARALAHFVTENCLGLYSPPLNKLVPCFQDETVAKLQSDDPIKAVFGKFPSPPVIPIEDDDPRLRSAEEEARRRFPEFENAFGRKDGTKFSVKSRIARQGKSEHVWIEVDRITQDNIEGRLGNEPVDLGDLKIGSNVTVTRNEVEDWAFVRNGAPVGLFTVAVIQQIEKER